MREYENFKQSGGYSLIIGPEYYKQFLKFKENKLVKVTKINEKHNELRYASIIRSIPDYDKYYTIPDEGHMILKNTDSVYIFLKELFLDHMIFLDKKNLSCFYVDYSGNKELIDTLNDMEIDDDFSYWKSFMKITKFSKFILTGLNFLHEKKMCHLDIKPENILINTKKDKCKIVDFGFSCEEPFDRYVYSVQGTPGYFPKHYDFDEITEWLPKIEANDTILVDNEIPFIRDRNLVYKIDSFCFGRTLFYLKYIYKKNRKYSCINLEKKDELNLDKIIDSLIENDVHKRLTPKQCLDTFFNF